MIEFDSIVSLYKIYRSISDEYKSLIYDVSISVYDVSSQGNSNELYELIDNVYWSRLDIDDLSVNKLTNKQVDNKYSDIAKFLHSYALKLIDEFDIDRFDIPVYRYMKNKMAMNRLSEIYEILIKKFPYAESMTFNSAINECHSSKEIDFIDAASASIAVMQLRRASSLIK